MHRDILGQLEAWRASAQRKPLFMAGQLRQLLGTML